MIFCPSKQKIGDILLVSTDAIPSKLNRVGQTIGSFKYATYSHAILALQKGTYIEAMYYGKNNPNNGVDILCIEELEERFKDEYYKNWKVIRNKEINDNIRTKIEEKSVYYFGQDYNKLFLTKLFKRKNYDTASFCSELIGRIYKDIGFGLSNRDVWPTHLEKLLENNLWKDITKLYKKKECNQHRDILQLSCQQMRVLYISQFSSSSNISSAISGYNNMIEEVDYIGEKIANVDPKKLKDYAIKSGLHKKENQFYSSYVSSFLNYNEREEAYKVLEKFNKRTVINWQEKDINAVHPNIIVNTPILEELIARTAVIMIDFAKNYFKYLDEIRFHADSSGDKTIILRNKKLKGYLKTFPGYYNNDLFKSYKAIKSVEIPVETIQNLVETIKKIIPEIHHFNYARSNNLIILDSKIDKENCANIVFKYSKYVELK